MANIEGLINIAHYPDQNSKQRIEITSTRPLQACKILIGKTPDEALTIIPLVFSICGIAQSRAALAAVEDILKVQCDPSLEIAGDILLLAENAREHLLRIALDWPTLFGVDADARQLPYIGQLVIKFKTALFAQGRAFSLERELNADLNMLNTLVDTLDTYLEERLFRMPAKEWLESSDVDGVIHWAEQTNSIAARSILEILQRGWFSLGCVEPQPLPELEPNMLLERFNATDASEYIARPQWLGSCCETTPFTRQKEQPLIKTFYKQFDASLITRWISRLVEVALIPQQLRALIANMQTGEADILPPSGLGLAQVEAARGRLFHRVDLAQGRITNYQILAPTEWNFHPQGVVSQMLRSLTITDKVELDRISRVFINTIDPCVGFNLRLH